MRLVVFLEKSCENEIAGRRNHNFLILGETPVWQIRSATKSELIYIGLTHVDYLLTPLLLRRRLDVGHVTFDLPLPLCYELKGTARPALVERAGSCRMSAVGLPAHSGDAQPKGC